MGAYRSRMFNFENRIQDTCVENSSFCSVFRNYVLVASRLRKLGLGFKVGYRMLGI